MTWAMTEKCYSQRRACRLVGIDPRVHRYQSSRSDDAALRSRLRELSSERRRFGYRRLHILLEREGRVSIGVEWCPPIGVQKCPLCRAGEQARGGVAFQLAQPTRACVSEGVQARVLMRQLSLPVSTMSQW